MVRAAIFDPRRYRKTPEGPPGGSYEPSSTSSVFLPLGCTVSVAPNEGKPPQAGRRENSKPSRCGLILASRKAGHIESPRWRLMSPEPLPEVLGVAKRSLGVDGALHLRERGTE